MHTVSIIVKFITTYFTKPFKKHVQQKRRRENGVVLIGEFVIIPVSVKNRHRICMHKWIWAVAQIQKQKKRLVTQTNLFFLFVCQVIC